MRLRNLRKKLALEELNPVETKHLERLTRKAAQEQPQPKPGKPLLIPVE